MSSNYLCRLREYCMVATCTISILVDFATVGLANSCIRQMVVGCGLNFGLSICGYYGVSDTLDLAVGYILMCVLLIHV
ncbi:hypothetical protein M752DRAFT_69018 [Aspergillus phoenicis ATCC 13157]|uniref:Uncharacterized protein n=1 Tax=Aspergillus phoenicis ATCC 13157 TaxID=1353007 RepID=A0A370PXY7_ASPPH|nr:hypothetical protein M752DRAFT_69018 [Aspergillus phoenicis ATCC 13157]